MSPFPSIEQASCFDCHKIKSISFGKEVKNLGPRGGKRWVCNSCIQIRLLRARQIEAEA